MYLLRSKNFEQKNMEIKQKGIQDVDKQINSNISIHWLNPLLHRCKENFHLGEFIFV